MLDKDRLTNKIKKAFDAVSDKQIDASKAREQVAQSIATAIIDEILSATITVDNIKTTGEEEGQEYTQIDAVEATIT